MKTFPKLIITTMAVITLAGCASTKKIATLPTEITMNRSVLMDKVKGAWAGQTGLTNASGIKP